MLHGRPRPYDGASLANFGTLTGGYHKVSFDMTREGTKVRAVFTINEGPQQTIETILILGASLFNVDALRAVLLSRTGGPYFAANVQRDIDELHAVVELKRWVMRRLEELPATCRIVDCRHENTMLQVANHGPLEALGQHLSQSR